MRWFDAYLPLSRTALRFSLLAAAAATTTVLFAVHSRKFQNFLIDDALISLQYVKRMLAGHGLTWSDGPAVEGYSNLLWILLISIPGYFGVDLIEAAQWLGMICTALLPVILLYYNRNESWPVLASTAIMVLFLPLSVIMTLWAHSGLEQPLVTLLLLIAVLLVFAQLDQQETKPRILHWLSVTLGLLAVNRPDGALFTVSVFAAFLLIRWRWRRAWSLRELSVVVVYPVVFLSLQMIFRLIYYNDWIPNTARIKLAVGEKRLWSGLDYLSSAFVPDLVFWFVVALSCVVMTGRARFRLHVFAISTLFLAWATYVVLIGGDNFVGSRHVTPLIVLGMSAIVVASRSIFPASNGKRAIIGFLFLAMFSAVALPEYYKDQRSHRHYPFVHGNHWLWQGQVLGNLLHDAFSDKRPLVGVTAAGCIPYWSGLPALDMLGLNDRYIAREFERYEPATFSHRWLGHEAGNAEYVLSRAPDIIVFTVGSPDIQFVYSEAFKPPSAFDSLYLPIWLRGKIPFEYAGMVWIRRESPRIGMTHDHNGITIPGMLFASSAENAAMLTASGQLVTPVNAGETVHCDLPGDITSYARISIRGINTSALRVEMQGVRISVNSQSDGSMIEALRIDYQ